MNFAPYIGQRVHYWPNHAIYKSHKDGWFDPFVADVVFVHGDWSVNLAFMDHAGNRYQVFRVKVGHDPDIGSSTFLPQDAEAKSGNASIEAAPVDRMAALSDEAISAVVTLKSLGYTYHGGELWKPPLGSRKPDGIDASRLTASDSNLSGLTQPAESARNIPLTVTGSELSVLVRWHSEGAADDTCDDMDVKYRFARRAAELHDLYRKHRPDIRAAGAPSELLPPPFDSQEEAQRAAGIWPQEAEPATVRVPSGRAAGMSSVMQPQGSSLRPGCLPANTFPRAADQGGGCGKPCGCKKAAP